MRLSYFNFFFLGGGGGAGIRKVGSFGLFTKKGRSEKKPFAMMTR